MNNEIYNDIRLNPLKTIVRDLLKEYDKSDDCDLVHSLRMIQNQLDAKNESNSRIKHFKLSWYNYIAQEDQVILISAESEYEAAIIATIYQRIRGGSNYKIDRGAVQDSYRSIVEYNQDDSIDLKYVVDKSIKLGKNNSLYGEIVSDISKLFPSNHDLFKCKNIDDTVNAIKQITGDKRNIKIFEDE